MPIDRWRLSKDEWGYTLILVRHDQEFPLTGAHFHNILEVMRVLDAPIEEESREQA